MTIGQRIKNRREQLGIPQSELARMVGITKQSLYKYETSIITNIPSNKIEAIAKKLETTPAYLMGWINSDEDTIKRDDTIADIILQIRSDEELLELVKGICNLPKEQRSAVQTLLSAFNSNM